MNRNGSKNMGGVNRQPLIMLRGRKGFMKTTENFGIMVLFFMC